LKLLNKKSFNGKNGAHGGILRETLDTQLM
jgi:hypothetical protein